MPLVTILVNAMSKLDLRQWGRLGLMEWEIDILTNSCFFGFYDVDLRDRPYLG